MTLVSGTRFGAYEVGEAIGAGGMGEVYRATDTTLERDVALKVLPASFAEDAERVTRFEREAKTLASLNHPNIAQIYGLEKSDGTTALIMELVDGATLEERIAKGPIPADEAIGIAMQIGDALEAAHGHSIVHRDLKPANIKLNSDGTVKVLDFGIAKALAQESLTSEPQSPIMTTPATQVGVILGTAAYMSPEQARGKGVDQRTDIWAFGCVLYEMLTGQLAFGGEDVSVTLARIIANDTNFDSLPASISPAVRKTIEICLEKDVRKRVADIRDVKLALAGAFETIPSPAATAAAARKPTWKRAMPIVAPIATAAVAAVAVWLGTRPEPRPINRFAFDIPPEQSFRYPGWNVVTFAGDGRSIVYNTDDGLFVRSLDALAPRLIGGTEEGLASPSIGPDGQNIVFVTVTGEIKRVSMSGGASTSLTNLVTGGSGTSWSVPEWVLFGQPDGIYRVSANGGASQRVVTSTEGEIILSHSLLPGGDLVLFSSTRGASANDVQIYVQSIATGERTLLIDGGVDARYLPTGHLIYAFEDALFVTAFDIDTLTVSGPAVPVIQGIMRGTTPSGSGNYGVSNDGTLVYAMGDLAVDSRVFVWVDRNGTEEAIAAPPRAYTSPRLSPDGSRIVVNARDQEIDIWIWDIVRTTLTRLTFDPGQERFPVWSPDSQRIAYLAPSAEDGFNWQVVSRASDGTGTPERLARSVGQLFPTAYLPDASGILAYGDMVDPDDDIALVELDGSDGSDEARPLLNSTFAEAMPEISPDGRWMAYVSNESGREEVYVRPFPDINSGRWQISTGGGTEPLWSRDGAELFFRRGGAVMAVPVQTAGGFAVGNAQLVFDGPYFEGVAAGGRSYDISPDGQRFLMIRAAVNTSVTTQIVIVENWFEELERLLPTE